MSVALVTSRPYPDKSEIKQRPKDIVLGVPDLQSVAMALKFAERTDYQMQVNDLSTAREISVECPQETDWRQLLNKLAFRTCPENQQAHQVIDPSLVRYLLSNPALNETTPQSGRLLQLSLGRDSQTSNLLTTVLCIAALFACSTQPQRDLQQLNPGYIDVSETDNLGRHFAVKLVNGLVTMEAPFARYDEES